MTKQISVNKADKSAESIFDLALEILEKTNDGNDLSITHLRLVEAAVNGFLDKHGNEQFRRLADCVRQGDVKPWFHGIEHMTIDHHGFVFWKDIVIEQFHLSWAYSDEAKGKAAKLARRCRTIEERCETPCYGNLVRSSWDSNDGLQVLFTN